MTLLICPRCADPILIAHTDEGGTCFWCKRCDDKVVPMCLQIEPKQETA